MKASLAKASRLDGATEYVTEQESYTDVKDATEAAASQFRKLVNPEHLNITSRTSLPGEPLFELDHLDVLESDAGMDAALDDRLGDVHSASDCLVVSGLHAIMLGQFINLNLLKELAIYHPQLGCTVLREVSFHTYLSKLPHVSDFLALQAAEIRGDPTVLEIHDSGERLVEEGSNGRNWEASGFGSEGVNHGFESHVNLPSANDLGHVCYCRLAIPPGKGNWLNRTNHWGRWAQEELLGRLHRRSIPASGQCRRVRGMALRAY